MQIWGGAGCPSDPLRGVSDWSTASARSRIISAEWGSEWGAECARQRQLATGHSAPAGNLWEYASIYGDHLAEAVGLRAAMDAIPGARVPRLQPMGCYTGDQLPPVFRLYGLKPILCTSCQARLEALFRAWAGAEVTRAWIFV